MTQSRDEASTRDTSPESELSQAQQRAQRAEKKVEELERTVAALKPRTSDAGDESTASDPQRGSASEDNDPTEKQLRADPMMAHLMDSLAAGKDIGHYGRLVFAMVAHHFLPPEKVLEWLTRDPDFSEEQAAALLRQVESRDYNPPRRERILAWQAEQEFPIIPNVDDPDCGNLYRHLKFPDKVYEHIQEYQEEKAEAGTR